VRLGWKKTDGRVRASLQRIIQAGRWGQAAVAGVGKRRRRRYPVAERPGERLFGVMQWAGVEVDGGRRRSWLTVGLERGRRTDGRGSRGYG